MNSSSTNQLNLQSKNNQDRATNYLDVHINDSSTDNNNENNNDGSNSSSRSSSNRSSSSKSIDCSSRCGRSIDESNINDFSDIACLQKQQQHHKQEQQLSQQHQEARKLFQHPSTTLSTNQIGQQTQLQQQYIPQGQYDINFDGSMKRRRLFEQEVKASAFVTHNSNSILPNNNNSTSRQISSQAGRHDTEELNQNNPLLNNKTITILNSSLRNSKDTLVDLAPHHQIIKEAFSEKVYLTNEMISQRAMPSAFSSQEGIYNQNTFNNFQHKESIRLDRYDTGDRSKGKVSFATVAEDEIQMSNIRSKYSNNQSPAVSILGIQSPTPAKRRFDNTSYMAQSSQRLNQVPKQRWAQQNGVSNGDRQTLGDKVLGVLGNGGNGPGGGMINVIGGQIGQSANTNNNNCNNNEEIGQKAKNHFVILSYITKFVKSLILRVSYRDFMLLEPKHFGMIGDAAYSQKSRKSKVQKSSREMMANGEFQYEEDLLKYRKYQLKTVKEKDFDVLVADWIEKITKFVCECKVFSLLLCTDRIFLPDQLAVIAWDFLVLITILFHLIIFPVKLCFFLKMPNEDYETIIYFIPFMFFAIDLLIGFNTGIFEFGVIVKDRKLISQAFWKNKLPFHLALTLALFLNYKIDSVFIELCAVYIRLNQISQRMSKVNQHFQITFKFPKLSELLQLLALVLFIAHICGCGFHYIGDLSLQSGQNTSWIIQSKAQDESWLYRYTLSIYFAIVTMVTIGYGDIVPTNVYERIYVIFMILFSCGIFAYCINAIGNIFLEQNTKHKAFQQKIFDVQEYLQSKLINKETQTRVFKYLEYLNEQSDEILTKGQMILSECSQDLREEILKDYYGKILIKLRILHNNFSQEFISTLSTKMKERRFGPGEVILHQGSQLKNIYFISKGGIEFFVSNGSKKIPTCTLHKNFHVIDFRLFISEISCPYSVGSVQTTTVAYFSLEDFISTIKQFPLDYEKYCMIRNQFLLDGRFESQCLSCGQFGHDFTSCPQIHYNVNLPIFTQRIFFSQIQNRQELQKLRGQRKHATRLNLQSVKYDLKMIRWMHAQLKHEYYGNIDIIQESSQSETDKEFYLRCPKIKHNFWNINEADLLFKKTAMNSIAASDFNKEDDSSNQESSSSEDESEIQTEESEMNLISNNNNNTNTINTAPTPNQLNQLIPLTQSNIVANPIQNTEKNGNQTNNKLLGITNEQTIGMIGSDLNESSALVKTVLNVTNPVQGPEIESQSKVSSQTSIGRCGHEKTNNNIANTFSTNNIHIPPNCNSSERKKGTLIVRNPSYQQIEGYTPEDQQAFQKGLLDLRDFRKRKSRKNTTMLMRSQNMIPLVGSSQNIALNGGGGVGGLGGIYTNNHNANGNTGNVVGGGGGGGFLDREISYHAESILTTLRQMLIGCLEDGNQLPPALQRSRVNSQMNIDGQLQPSSQKHIQDAKPGILNQQTLNNSKDYRNYTNSNNNGQIRKTHIRNNVKYIRGGRYENRSGSEGHRYSFQLQHADYVQQLGMEDSNNAKQRHWHEQTFISNNQQSSSSGGKHIFGNLHFSFDSMKEFVLYYPKYNCSSVLKSYKKTWQKVNLLIKTKKNPFVNLMMSITHGHQGAHRGSQIISGATPMSRLKSLRNSVLQTG